MFCFPEQAQWIEALPPAADAAGRTGDYVSLRNAGRCYVIVHVDQGNAATITLTIEQAKDVAGTASKAITNVVPIWANEDLAASPTLVRQTDAVAFTTSAAVKHKVVMFQIDPSTLDVANGFDCITVKTGASHADNITEAAYILTDIKYGGLGAPSPIVD